MMPSPHAETYLASRLRLAWCGPSLLVLDLGGGCGRHGLSGLFFREARHLSTLRLELFGEEPQLASMARVSPRRLESTFLHPPVTERRGGGTGSGGSSRRHGVLARGLDVTAAYRVRPARLELRLGIAARWDEEVELDVAWHLGADFADLLQAVAGGEGPGSEAEERPGGVVFRCRRAELPLETRVGTGAGGWRWHDDGRLRSTLTLHRQSPVEVGLFVDAVDGEEPLSPEEQDARETAVEHWQSAVTRVAVPGHGFADLVNGAMADLGSLALLDGPGDEWLAPAAGVPYYPAFFGRDALTAGWQAAVFDQGELLYAAHRKVCRLLGREHDPWRDEMPGRVVQQARRGPLARLGENPFGRYYGDYASPLMFVVSLGQMYAWSGDRRPLRRSWPHALEALAWAEEHGDLDGDGYLEYRTLSPEGPLHQGWKDSDNAVVDERGNQVAPPFAACEIQGYWYAALQIAAVLAAAQGQLLRARRLWRRAARLKERFNRDFWLEEEGFLAFGLDADKRPVRSLTSNAGQCLATGIVADRHVPRLVERLFEPDLFSGWGLRTLSAQNPAYNPLSYHLGSVWPVENATILLGLRRYRMDEPALRLAAALWDLARLWRDGRLPECVGGYAREEAGHPGAYPHANAPQAWNQSLWPLLVQSLLGLQPVAPLRLLTVDPVLPEWLPELELQGLRVGGARVDLAFRRDRKGRTRFRILGRKGRLRVVRQPPVDALGVGWLGRLAALLRRR